MCARVVCVVCLYVCVFAVCLYGDIRRLARAVGILFSRFTRPSCYCFTRILICLFRSSRAFSTAVSQSFNRVRRRETVSRYPRQRCCNARLRVACRYNARSTEPCIRESRDPCTRAIHHTRGCFFARPPPSSLFQVRVMLDIGRFTRLRCAFYCCCLTGSTERPFVVRARSLFRFCICLFVFSAR